MYGEALRFSFFFDDAFDLTRTEQESFRSLAGPLEGYGYYRPIPFMLWKALFLATGRYDTGLLHALPLVFHALAAWLLFLLMRRLTGSLWSLIPMALFVVFPFSYQAVPIIGTVFHPMVTAEILAAMVLWYDGRVCRNSWRIVAASALAALALWTHEFGAAVVPMLAALEALLWFQRRVARPTLWLLMPLAVELVFLGIWFSIDKPAPEPVSLRDVARNARFGLQGFAFPVSAQANWLAGRLHLDPVRLVGPLAALGTTATLVVHALRSQGRLALGALAWAGFAFLPAVGTLTYAYMENGPRLLYVIAPGASIFWGSLAMIRFGRPGVTAAWRVGVLIVLALAAMQAVAFIRVRMQMLEHATAVADGVIQAGTRHAGGQLLMINVPSWFAPKSQEYPLGHLGVQVEPAYIGLDRLIYAGSLAQVDVESRSLAPDVSGWLYNFGPHGEAIDHGEVDARLRAGAGLVVVDLYRDVLEVREPGVIRPDQPPPPAHQAVFGDGLWLVDWSLDTRGKRLQVTTRWYTAAPVTDDYQIWTQLRRSDGRVVAERRDYALRGMSPPRLWRRGDLVEDRLVLDLSNAPDRSTLEVWLAVVRSADGMPLPITSGSSAVIRDGWLDLGSVAE